ncbi:hypothetical protein [Paludisphaera soli]|uniref:hypothetical protein n=1 Tax=Paludisphaera soli TaxID=2712865 RepID=UPI0013EB4B62|nr:hypothetical protein [Paludisphaera soli]
MKTKKHGFVPSLDGRLEDRIVLNGSRAAAGIVVNLPGGEQRFVPKSAILTTRTYHDVLVNIHRATQQFGRTQGVQRNYDNLGRQLGAQLGRLPYARQDGLIDYVNGSLQFYSPAESRQLYSDIRSTAISYLSSKVFNGEAAIRKSSGHYFSDADIYGRHAAIYSSDQIG